MAYDSNHMKMQNYRHSGVMVTKGRQELFWVIEMFYVMIIMFVTLL